MQRRTKPRTVIVVEASPRTAVVVDVGWIGRREKVLRVEREMRLCVAPVSTMALMTRRLIVIGTKISDGLGDGKEGRPSRTSFILLGEMENEVICDQVGCKSSK